MFRSHSDIVRVSPQPPKRRSHSPDAAPDAGEDQELLSCDFCQLRWHTELDLDLHRKNWHLGDIQRLAKSNKQHVCLICVRKQSSAAALIEHIKSEHLLSSPTTERIQREIFICNHCKNIFFNKALLIVHIRHVHKDPAVERHQCPRCYKMINRTNLLGHLMRHSLGVPSTCQICFAEFKNKVKLKYHMKTHPYYLKCDTCQYATNREKHFAEHVALHRSPARDAACASASRYFVGGLPGVWQYRCSTGLRGLRLYHVFVCVLCRQLCRGAADMRRHVALEHGARGARRVAGAGRRGVGAGAEPGAGGARCACGECFSHAVLLKQHVLRLQGAHRPRTPVEEDEECIESIVLSDEEEVRDDDNPALQLETYELMEGSTELVEVYAVKEEDTSDDGSALLFTDLDAGGVEGGEGDAGDAAYTDFTEESNPAVTMEEIHQ